MKQLVAFSGMMFLLIAACVCGGLHDIYAQTTPPATQPTTDPYIGTPGDVANLHTWALNNQQQALQSQASVNTLMQANSTLTQQVAQDQNQVSVVNQANVALSQQVVAVTQQNQTLAATTQASANTITQLQAQNTNLQSQLAAVRGLTPYNVIVTPGTNALQNGLNVVPPNGTIYICNGHYTETPSIPRACKIIGQSESGVVIDAGGKAYTMTLPVSSDLSNVTIINSAFGTSKTKSAALSITDGCNITDVSATSDCIGISIKGTGGAGGAGITATNITTNNCGEEGLSVGLTRGCVITNWTSSNNLSSTSYNPHKVVYSAGNEGGAGKFAYNDGLKFIGVIATNNPCNGPWFDTGNTNCSIAVTTISGNGMSSQPGLYAGMMIEQNDGTNSQLGTTGINGATVNLMGGVFTNNQHNDVLIAESSGVVVGGIEYHDQIGMRQIATRASKIHNITITNCDSYGSTYPDKVYTATSANIATQKISMNSDRYHAMPRNIGYWCNQTQTTIPQLQAFGLETNGVIVP